MYKIIFLLFTFIQLYNISFSSPIQQVRDFVETGSPDNFALIFNDTVKGNEYLGKDPEKWRLSVLQFAKHLFSVYIGVVDNQVIVKPDPKPRKYSCNPENQEKACSVDKFGYAKIEYETLFGFGPDCIYFDPNKKIKINLKD